LKSSFALRFWFGAFVFLALTPPGNSQEIIRQDEHAFGIAVRGTNGGVFHGTYLAVGAGGDVHRQRFEGTIPANFRAIGSELYVVVQSREEGGTLDVELSKAGTVFKRQSTSVGHGVVSVQSITPEGGLPRETDFELTGSAKYAFLTITTGSGETYQEQVKLPYSKKIFPKEGWVVGMSAQKKEVTRPDPLSVQPRTEVLSDGKEGALRVSIRVTGQVVATEETAEAFGIASAMVKIR